MLFKNTQHKGFTIVEMMIAMSIFAVVLLLTSSVILGLSKQQQKSVFTARLNDSSRTIHRTISDGISYGQTINIDNIGLATQSDYGWFCADSKQYFWHKQVGTTIGAYPGLYVRSIGPSGCIVPNDSMVATSTNMLPMNGFVTNLSITKQGPAYSVQTTFNVGTADMFDVINSSLADPNTVCLPALRGGDFCTQVKYNNVVVQKVGG